ncbi:unnamed protein product [Rhodiola kirilowii]
MFAWCLVSCWSPNFADMILLLIDGLKHKTSACCGYGTSFSINILGAMLVQVCPQMYTHGRTSLPLWDERFPPSGLLSSCFHCLESVLFYLDNEENLNNVVVVWNSLLNMYDKCGVLKDAARLFDEMPVRDTISWNTMISRQLSYRGLEFGFQLFKERQDVGSKVFEEMFYRNVVTWTAIVSGLAQNMLYKDSLNMFVSMTRGLVHGLVMKLGLHSDVCLESSLMDMYCKCGNVEDSLRIFESADKIDDVSLRIFNPISPKLILHDSYFHLPNPKIIDAARQTLTPQLAVLARSVPPKMPEIHHHPKPIYLAVKGRIFDVTSGKSFYGPGGAYEMFAGKDASRALAKMSKNEDDVVADIDGLSSKEIGVLGDWERKFEAKYSILGRVV